MTSSSAAATPYDILVVDDEPDLRTLYELTLLREGYRVEAAQDLREARAALEHKRFHAVITDMRLPDGLGIELLRELSAGQRPERAIVITAHGSAENAVEALKCGAFDYLTKPVDLKQFRSVVASALHSLPGEKPLQAARQAASAPTLAEEATDNSPLARIVGPSVLMQTVRQRIERVARSMAPVLVLGESGTGKELVARALHGCSHRASAPFVAVNCGAIPESLIEAEFFGVRKGAYTGATQDREGYCQAAHGGTLFLDEIGDLPLSMQAKLLRVVQERQVRALGAVQEERIDVRLVSATHKDLAAEVKAGRFRQDLFYRLNVIEVRMPALRERREDLESLVHALLRRICAESGQPLPEVSPEAMAWLQQHPLPGNVRELENLLHRALALCGSETITPEDLHDGAPPPLDTDGAPAPAEPAAPGMPTDAGVAAPAPTDLQAYLDQQEREVLVRVLRETHFNRTLAAAKLGLNLRQIRYRIQRLQIPMPNGTPDNDE
ncbi:sigma-54-dependent transcriptional regulator [Hydrogenophaga sp. OTU3427]|uniref:sigma-54-dependent transcriptional regulator n=1 Tax=Hydrogenophaga sp. OTU3427 TaxID=3043856 RepID=UPI00313ECB34